MFLKLIILSISKNMEQLVCYMLLMAMITAKTSLENCQYFLKLNIEISYDPAIPLLLNSDTYKCASKNCTKIFSNIIYN